MNMKNRLTAALLLDQVRDTVSTIHTLRTSLTEAVQERDECLCELRAIGVPYATLMKLTGLSRDRVMKITAQAKGARVLDAEHSLIMASAQEPRSGLTSAYHPA